MLPTAEIFGLEPSPDVLLLLCLSAKSIFMLDTLTSKNSREIRTLYLVAFGPTVRKKKIIVMQAYILNVLAINGKSFLSL